MNMHDAPREAPAATHATATGGKYLTFHLAGEEFGLPIMKVQEIIGLMPVTRVPRLPDYVRGVINLRGRIHPTVDLRLKFGLPATADTERTCIIVVEVATERGHVNMGVIVDEVAEVLDIADTEIDSTPEFGVAVSTEFILGLAVVKGNVKMLLDIERILTAKEIGELASVVSTANAGS
jgi:purine-binding chemotaxis protein CheW